jgi:hypothetical protein
LQIALTPAGVQIVALFQVAGEGRVGVFPLLEVVDGAPDFFAHCPDPCGYNG